MKIIKTSLKISQYGGKQNLECTMEDGSIWTCNVDGSVFVKIAPSHEELTDKFNKQKHD